MQVINLVRSVLIFIVIHLSTYICKPHGGSVGKGWESDQTVKIGLNFPEVE